MARQPKSTPTIQDIAEALGVNKSTVSQGLSGKGTLSAAMRARVMTAAHEIGYRPHPLAQRLARGRSSTLVCITAGSLDVGLGTSKILMVQKELAARSFEVPIYACPALSGEDGKAAADQIQQLCRQMPLAIICMGASLHPDALPELEAYQDAGGIVVNFDLEVALDCDQVVFDREDNAYRAARHLLELGHRKIAMTNTRGNSARPIPTPQSFRFLGFQRALAEFGVSVHPEWVFQNEPYEEGGEELARNFLALKERPTGICIVNDYVALAFMSDLLRAGVRVPEEVSIVSHDNQRIASHCPVPLTSVAHPAQEIAHAVVQLLIQRIEGYDGPPRTITLHGELVRRQSVAPPPTV